MAREVHFGEVWEDLMDGEIVMVLTGTACITLVPGSGFPPDEGEEDGPGYIRADTGTAHPAAEDEKWTLTMEIPDAPR